MFYLLYGIKTADTDMIITFIKYFRKIATHRRGRFSFQSLADIVAGGAEGAKTALLITEFFIAGNFDEFVCAGRLKEIVERFDFQPHGYIEAAEILKDMALNLCERNGSGFEAAFELLIKIISLPESNGAQNLKGLMYLTRWIRSEADVRRLEKLAARFASKTESFYLMLSRIMHAEKHESIEALAADPVVARLAGCGIMSPYSYKIACDETGWNEISGALKRAIAGAAGVSDRTLETLCLALKNSFNERLVAFIEANSSRLETVLNRVLPFINKLAEPPSGQSFDIMTSLLDRDEHLLMLIIDNYFKYCDSGIIKDGPDALVRLESFFARQRKEGGKGIIADPQFVARAIGLDDVAFRTYFREFYMVHNALLYGKTLPASADAATVKSAEEMILSAAGVTSRFPDREASDFPGLSLQSDIYMISAPRAGADDKISGLLRWPDGLKRLAAGFRLRPHDRGLYWNGVLDELAAVRSGITARLESLPEKARAAQTGYLNSLVFLGAAVEKRSRGDSSAPDDAWLSVLLLMFIAGRKGCRECENAAAGLLGEIFRGGPEGAGALEEFCSRALANGENDRLTAEALKPLTIFWGRFLGAHISTTLLRASANERALLRVAWLLMPSDKRCRGIIGNAGIDGGEKAKRLAAHLVEEFKRVFP